jgi:glutaconate CoA-transferase, subunit B
MDSENKAATASEMMAARAAKELANGEVVFVGIGLPNVACNLARETHAPQLTLIYESGAVGAQPERLPVSIGDPALVTGALAIVSQSEIFQNYLQGGRIQVGFLGGAQVDKWGNLNTTVVGDYKNPKVRLPGSGGACEIAIHAQRVLIVMRLSPKSFVDECDYITSPGQVSFGKTRKELGLAGDGPTKIITDLCVLEWNESCKEFIVTELYPSVQKEDVSKQCGWPVQFADHLNEAEGPSEKEIKLLREKLDPQRLYL